MSRTEKALALFDSEWPSDIKPAFDLPVVVRGGTWGKSKTVEWGFLQNPTLTDDYWRVNVYKANGKFRSFIAALANMRPQFSSHGVDLAPRIVQAKETREDYK